MRVVFDTNVIVAGVVDEGLCREIFEIYLPEHEAVLSRVLWDELLSTLRRKFGLVADDLTDSVAVSPPRRVVRP